jgi:hypothetical protein
MTGRSSVSSLTSPGGVDAKRADVAPVVTSAPSGSVATAPRPSSASIIVSDVAAGATPAPPTTTTTTSGGSDSVTPATAGNKHHHHSLC